MRFNTLERPRFVLRMAVAVTALAPVVHADVLYGNFGPGMTFDNACFNPTDPASFRVSASFSVRGHWSLPPGTLVWSWWGQGISSRFTPAATGTFTSAQVALATSERTKDVWVYLQRAAADGLPGPVLEEIRLPATPAGVRSATSQLRPQLRAGVSYWLTLLPARDSFSCWGASGMGLEFPCAYESSARWCLNSIGELAADGVAKTNDKPTSWSLVDSGAARGAFQVNGDTSIPVVIDVKPGELPNSVNPRSNGVIAVALLSSGSFDVAAVQRDSIRFGRTGTEAPPVHHALEHVNGDGFVDLILHFRTQQTGIACGTTQATLTGATANQRISGRDSIHTVGCK